MENDTPTVVNNSSVKFTDDESKELADIRAGFDKAAITFGRLYLRRRDLEKTEAHLTTELDLLEKQEKAFLDKIVAKYGEGTYDSTTGIYTPKKKA
jgi:hypothetical protein